jgi:NADPH:quinone reductase-like Zn-dependent oxidoreductase
MKAVRFHQFGGIEHLRYEEVPTPTAGPGEVVVAVAAAALNHLDLWLLQGIPAYSIQLPHFSGCDVSGVIETVGPDVRHVAVGDRVIIAPGLSCFRCPACLSGRDNLCETHRIFGAGCLGGFAERTCAPVDNLIPIPDGISFEEAAAFPLTFLTAWHMLIARARLKSGQTVLVMAGGSGIGSAAIQIARYVGARVIAQVSTPAKRERARAGADEVIDDTQGDVVERVREITEGRGVEVVVEHTGPDGLARGLRMLSPGGTLVTCGATTGAVAEVDLRQLFSKDLSVLGARMGTRAEFLEITRLVGERKLSPMIDSVRPLSELPDAYRKMQSRDFFGKLIVKP